MEKLTDLQETLQISSFEPITTLAFFYDDILDTSAEFLQSAYGLIVSPTKDSDKINGILDTPIMNALIRNGYERIRMPKIKKAIVCQFQSTSNSYFPIAYAKKVIYPAVRNFIKKMNNFNPVYIEVYDNDNVYLVIPLENEYEYKVPKYEIMLTEPPNFDSDSTESDCYSDTTESISDEENIGEYELNDVV
uniref:ORFan n=1 Tax=Parastrongyloides trichosuri TaxID=131310 RepID=A0A0N4ZBB7_PARTI